MRIKSGTDHLDFSTDYQLWQMYCMQTGADQRLRTNACHTFIAWLLLFVGENLHVLTACSHHFFFLLFFVIDVTITCFPIIPLCHTSTSSPSTSQWAGRDGFFFPTPPFPPFYLCFLIAREKYSETLLNCCFLI